MEIGRGEGGNASFEDFPVSSIYIIVSSERGPVSGLVGVGKMMETSQLTF